MPGPISDSYDPEFGTGYNCHRIREEIQKAYNVVSSVLGYSQPMYIVDLAEDKSLNKQITATFTEKTWRIIRFALERAEESI